MTVQKQFSGKQLTFKLTFQEIYMEYNRTFMIKFFLILIARLSFCNDGAKECDKEIISDNLAEYQCDI